MTDSDRIKLFCTEWLLQSECSRGTDCIFLHANMRDVTLVDELSEDEVFVKGSYNHGWQKKVRSRRGKPRHRHYNSRQHSNRDNNAGSRYNTRSNQRVQKQNEINPPSTSSSQEATSAGSSSSTGACKKVFNGNKNYNHGFASATSDSEDENSKNLANLPHSKIKNRRRNLVKSSEIADEAGKAATTTEDAAKNAIIKQEKKDSDIAVAVAESQEKVCGICFENILEKMPVERRFGILPNCNHCFCLVCIRKWRQAKQFENNIIRACPECRVTSDFVCPSTYWVDTESGKEKLINNYKQVLSTKDCKYFKKGSGSCPFGNRCFYLHALNNGTKIDVGPPPSLRHDSSETSDDMDLIQKLVLFEYLHNDFLDLSESDDDDDDDDDDDLFDYMFWDSDDDICFF